MKWINYHHLIYFKEIARQGSISKASEILKVGQPALSAQLKKLEEYIGVNLFERKNRRLILTEPGKVVLEYAEKIADLGQELIQVIEQKTFTQRIHLSVGAVDAIPKHLVSSIVDLAHKKTGCYLTILEGGPSELRRELESHNIDVLISEQELIGEGQGNLFSKKILRSRVHAYATEDFAHLKPRFPESMDGKPCIMPTNHSRLRTELDHFFHVNGIYVDRIAETQDSMLQKILSCKGDGVIFLPELAAHELVKEKKLIKIGSLKGIYVEYFLIYAKKIIENKALNLILKQNFKKMEY